MYCTKCGEPNADTYKNCRACGAKLKNPDGFYTDDNAAVRQEGAGKRRARAVIVSVLAAAVVLSAVLPSAASALNQTDSFAIAVQDGSFQTPEEAITFYIDALTDLDMEAALSACAVDEHASRFDVGKNITQVDTINAYMAAPKQYAFYQALNQATYLGGTARSIKCFIYSFTDSEAAQSIITGDVYMLTDDPAREAQEFVESVDPAVIRDLTIVSIDLPEPDSFYSEDNQSSNKAAEDIYGADEITERVALYELDGSYYFSGFVLTRYADSWKIYDSVIMDIAQFLGAQAITREEYAELVS